MLDGMEHQKMRCNEKNVFFIRTFAGRFLQSIHYGIPTSLSKTYAN